MNKPVRKNVLFFNNIFALFIVNRFAGMLILQSSKIKKKKILI